LLREARAEVAAHRGGDEERVRGRRLDEARVRGQMLRPRRRRCAAPCEHRARELASRGVEFAAAARLLASCCSELQEGFWPSDRLTRSDGC